MNTVKKFTTNFSNKVCVTNKTEYLNLSVFNMITGINESKTLSKRIENITKACIMRM